MTFSRRLLSFFTRARARPFDAPLQPDQPFYVIGDIHGCDHLLADLLDIIADHAAGVAAPIICVGDYIDRGEQSAEVLRRLGALSQDGAANLTCLLGNHEEMLLAFLDDPERNARLWLQNGGLQTLASFAIGGVQQNMPKAQLLAVHAQLLEALGDEVLTWLRGLPTMWSSGNVTVVHAAADPGHSVDDQPAKVLTWGHRDFLTTPRRDGQWIIHGHTIVPEIDLRDGRVGVDTGAFATGRLSAAYVSSSGVTPLVASVT